MGVTWVTELTGMTGMMGITGITGVMGTSGMMGDKGDRGVQGKIWRRRRKCFHCWTNKQQGKIELLRQWTLEGWDEPNTRKHDLFCISSFQSKVQTKFEDINSCGVSVYSSLLRQTLSEVKFFKLLSQLSLRGASKGSSVKKRKDISGVEIVNLVTYWPILVLNLHKLENHKGLVNMFYSEKICQGCLIAISALVVFDCSNGVFNLIGWWTWSWPNSNELLRQWVHLVM